MATQYINEVINTNSNNLTTSISKSTNESTNNEYVVSSSDNKSNNISHNTNVSNDTVNSTSTSSSTNQNTNFTSSVSNDTSNTTSNNVSNNTNTNTSTNTSTDFSTVVSQSDNTTHTTSVSTNTNSDTSVSQSTNTSFNTSTAQNTNNSQTDVEVSQTNMQASNYQADKTLTGVQTHESAETQRLNLKLAFANDKFDAILPLITSFASTGGSSGSSGPMGFHAMHKSLETCSTDNGDDYTIHGGSGMGHYRKTVYGNHISPRMGSGDVKSGGIGFASGSSVADAVAATNLPFIRTTGVLTPAQVQQSVNAVYARNDTRIQSETRRLIGEMTGRGFSPSSPILSALRVGLTGQSLRASIEGATQVQLESAKLNADNLLNSQKAVSDQFNQQESILVEQEKNTVTREVGVLSAIAQMVGSSL